MRPIFFVAASMIALGLAAPMALAADPTPPAAVVAHYGAWGVDLSTRDLTVAPGDDFFRYAQGRWYASAIIPPDQTSTGVDEAVFNRAQDQLRAMIEAAALAPADPTAAQIGALYKAFMDEPRVEALDAKPLQADLARIAQVADKAAFTVLMGQTHGRFGSSFFGLDIGPDPRHPETNILYIGQAGLGLPDRDYYLTDAFKAKGRPIWPTPSAPWP